MVARRPVTAVANNQAPSDYYAAVTPADTDLPFLTRYIYVGQAGTLAVQRPDGTNVLFVNLAAGIPHPIVAKQIRSTGTVTITNVAVLY